MQPARTVVLQGTIAVLLSLASLWAATQWAAATLAYQPALGPALVDLDVVKLYAPWKLFTWWLAFHTQAPDVFAPAGAVAALGGGLSGAFAIGGTARRAGRRSRPTTYGTVRWADFVDVNKAGLRRDRGVVLGLYRDRYLRHDGPEHVLAVAPTRSGKGVGLVLPTLLTWPGSAVRAYGVNHAILDNCHVRVAFAPNDERTARRLSEALGTATEIRRHRNVSGSRLSAWLPHLTMSEQETPRPLLTPGEVLQLLADEALVLVSGAPPIRARKLQYYADRNFLGRCLAAPPLSEGRFADAPPARGDDWSGRTRTTDARLEKAWFDLVAPTTTADENPPRTREIAPRRRKEKEQRSPADLPLFAWEAPEPGTQERDAPAGEELEKVVQFPGLRM